jgi:hypothetical protein
MDTWVWIVIVAAIVVIGLVAWMIIRSRQRAHLQERFGPEYDRAVSDAPSKREAEAELREREERRDELDIKPLSPASRDRYVERWRAAQAAFVDNPRQAIGEADRLVSEVMRERGYPTDDFERRASDISVDHPDVVENYRAAHEISLANDAGKADTEDLRRAMKHYRSLFEELLETHEVETR